MALSGDGLCDAVRLWQCCACTVGAWRSACHSRTVRQHSTAHNEVSVAVRPGPRSGSVSDNLHNHPHTACLCGMCLGAALAEHRTRAASTMELACVLSTGTGSNKPPDHRGMAAAM